MNKPPRKVAFLLSDYVKIKIIKMKFNNYLYKETHFLIPIIVVWAALFVIALK